MTAPPDGGDWPDSFGDAVEEYRAGRHRGAYAGGTRALLWAEGPDSVSFLQGILSQDVAGMKPGQAARSFLLEPRGKLQDLLWVLRGEERVGLVTTPARLPATLAALSRWKLRVAADLTADPRPMFEVWGPDAPVPPGNGWAVEEGAMAAELAVFPMRRCLSAGRSRRFLEEEEGIRPMGRLAYDTLRAEAGEPLMGVDLDEKTIPQETGLVKEAVSFDKGCFLGQELTARIDARGGRVNRRLRSVRMLHAAVPPPGAQVEYGGRTAGVLTTVGSANPRGTTALSLLHRSVEPGTEVEVVWEKGRFPAEAEEVPIPSRLV